MSSIDDKAPYRGTVANTGHSLTQKTENSVSNGIVAVAHEEQSKAVKLVDILNCNGEN